MPPYLYWEANEAEMPEQDPLAQVDDEDLALQMMEGDQDALRAAIKAYGPKVKGYLRKQFGDQLDQSERDYVFQQSLINFWERIRTYDTNKGSLRGWWIRIARNAAIDHIRGEKRHKAERTRRPRRRQHRRVRRRRTGRGFKGEEAARPGPRFHPQQVGG